MGRNCTAMTPLDLTLAPPRDPRAELAGVIFLPRSIDKLRAELPGGNPGVYTVAGFTEMMFEQLGIELATITAEIASAETEAKIAAFVQGATTPEKIAAWNAFVSQRQPRGGNRVEARAIFPWIDEHPELTLALDLLREDDRRLFAGRT